MIRKNLVLLIFTGLVPLFAAADTLDFNSTIEDVLEVLGKPREIRKDEILGRQVWKYEKGAIGFLNRKVISFDQTGEDLHFDLGERKKGVYLAFRMKAAEIPLALGTPSRVEINLDERDFSLWYYKQIPAPKGRESMVAVFRDRVLSWNLGDEKNVYSCRLWEDGVDEFETPLQKRVMKRIGPPVAVIRAVKNGRSEYTRYLFPMQKSGLYQIEFKGSLPGGYRVLNPGERPIPMETLNSIHPPLSARMTKRKVIPLDHPPGKILEQKSLWKKFLENCRPNP